MSESEQGQAFPNTITRAAKVQDYRLVLAEREARTHVRHEQRSSFASPEGKNDR